jgi:hypothetical protein
MAGRLRISAARGDLYHSATGELPPIRCDHASIGQATTRQRPQYPYARFRKSAIGRLQEMDKACVIHGWDAVTSASMDSQIAGVLAGFIFTGILLLLGQGGPKNIQALGLFCPAFIALALDSHLWGVVNGQESDPYCARIWSTAMPAAGMLAVGAMTIVTGLSWLIASHLEATPDSEAQPTNMSMSRVSLDRLMTLMAYGLGVTVTLLLASTTYDYLSVAFPKRQPAALAMIVTLSPVVVFAACVAIPRIDKWRAASQHTPKVITAARSLHISAYGVGAYAVACPVFGGIIGYFGNGWWQPTSLLIVVLTICVGLFAPALLLVALVLAVTPLSSIVTESHAPDENSSPGQRPLNWTPVLTKLSSLIKGIDKLAIFDGRGHRSDGD